MARPLVFKGDGTALVPVLTPKGHPLWRGSIIYALIDAADAHLVDDRNWFAKEREHTTYAHDRAGEPLHLRLFPMADEVDHLDHNGLNCRRSNLRPLSGKRTARITQNANTRPHRDGSVKGSDGRRLKGVRRDGIRYQARITVRGRRRTLGTFDTPEEAARAVDRATLKAFPNRAVYLNFPPHPFEEAHDDPAPAPRCWICLVPRKEHP